MEYIGHTSDDGRKQLLLDHLNGTSKLCRENANEFWADIAEFVGQIHDIGKVYIGFQKRINGAENIRVEHAICGAKEVAKAPPKSYVPMIEYCVSRTSFGFYLTAERKLTVKKIRPCTAE